MWYFGVLSQGLLLLGCLQLYKYIVHRFKFTATEWKKEAVAATFNKNIL